MKQIQNLAGLVDLGSAHQRGSTWWSLANRGLPCLTLDAVGQHNLPRSTPSAPLLAWGARGSSRASVTSGSQAGM